MDNKWSNYRTEIVHVEFLFLNLNKTNDKDLYAT